MKASETLKTLLTGSRLAPLAAIALGLSWAPSSVWAQGPRFGPAKSVQGRVESLTTAPMGEVDGATLEDGTLVHWPPHLADRFASVVTKGDRISVAGRMETGPEGDTHLEAQAVRNLRTNARAENDLGPPPRPPGPGRRAGEFGPMARRGPSKVVEGRIQDYTTAPRGEVDGVTLEGGMLVHWPPHLADRFTNAIGRGDRIRADGWMETGPAGDTHLEVRAVTNLATNREVKSDRAGTSADFDASPGRDDDLRRQIEALEDRIARLQDEVRRLRNEP
ncbi:hypothetical protein [Singulisphaera sp. PoT]|uniref:hypothetical protein n=1 Tax=Singulisphaera sp. PoT TaxID=3411797 RepID=UPI003BF61B2A